VRSDAIGDPNVIATRERLCELRAKRWGNDAENGMRTIGQWAGALWAFRTEVKRGDYVVCPDRNSGQYYIGWVRSERVYYDASVIGGTCEFAHRRKVKWLRILNRKELQTIWPTGQFGGRQTVSIVHAGENKLLRLLKGKRRSLTRRAHLPIQPDMEWGKEAEARAMAWLREKGYHPVNESD